MAIGTIPPWLRGPDTTGELTSGASEGAAAARLEQEARSESARLGMEAFRLRQSAALSQAQLQQEAEQHQMEFQARQKLAEQNQLRLQQQLNIQNAYKTAQLGIAKGRLEETQRAADEKARNAALVYQREQAFARDVASGVPVMEAYRRNPVSSALLSSAQRAGESDKPIHVGNAIVRRQPDGTYKTEYTAPASNKPIKVGKSLVKVNDDGTVTRIYSGETDTDVMGAANPAAQEPPKPGLLQRIFSSVPKPPTAPTEAPSKFGHPKVGDVRAGYRFKGGDPNDQKNWEPAKESE